VRYAPALLTQGRHLFSQIQLRIFPRRLAQARELAVLSITVTGTCCGKNYREARGIEETLKTPEPVGRGEGLCKNPKRRGKFLNDDD